MNNVKNNSFYLQKIVDDLQFILKHTNGITKEQLKENEVLLDSVMFRLVQVSENANKLTEDFKNKYGEIPWFAIRGMRNRIVHDYGDVDITVIYDTVTNDLQGILDVLLTLI